MKAEEIAEIISSPISHQFFTRNTAEDLIISCKYDWFIDYILDNLNLRSDEAAILEKVIIEKNAGSGVVPYLPLPELKKKVTN